MRKYKRLYNDLFEEFKQLDAKYTDELQNVKSSIAVINKLERENINLRKMLEKRVAECEILSKKIDADRASLEPENLRGRCEGCANQKITQRCASCVRNPHAKDKFKAGD